MAAFGVNKKKCLTLHLIVPAIMRMKVKIHHEGTGVLIVTLLVLLAINIPLWLWVRPMAWAIAFTIVSAALYLLIVNFFRSPIRDFNGNPDNVVVSSADGTVVALEETFEDEVLHCRCIQLSVFMTLLNVHANWFPVDGIVTYVKHHSGRFLSAWLPKSSTENERTTVAIETPHGQKIVMRQVAGAMARRIVTYATVGEDASIENHMGFIKFGSRVDLYLPLGTEIFVKIGDSTIGGITEVARLHPDKEPKNA